MTNVPAPSAPDLAGAQLAGISLDPRSAVPLYRQLYDGLRSAILAGQLAPGVRLPSTRDLAADLRVSRNTVLTAFDQLTAEGYLEGQVGAGTYVARELPDDLLAAGRHATRQPARTAPPPAPSERSRRLAQARLPAARGWDEPRAFRTGLPALDAFPFDDWARIVARVWRRQPADLLAYGQAAGYRPLREAIATYAGAARAVRCTPDQVIIVAGSQQALDLAARVLLDAGDRVWMEEPGYAGARGAFINAGLTVAPVPVGPDGLEIAAGQARAPDARLVYVTPSHQYPLGITMSLPRRLALLEWAERAGTWILEDDYDSEYRYTGRPLAALQGLDRSGRVIYLGTFSKVLFPGLRLGYLIVPPDLVDAFTAARALADRHSPLLDQAVLAEFITEGHFARHIRRTRLLYAERRAALLAAADEHLAGLLELGHAGAGMHVAAFLPPGRDDQQLSRQAYRNGLDLAPLSGFHADRGARAGFVLGYAAVDPPAIRAGIKKLAALLRGDRAGA